jgi:hypothetical protein
MDGDGQPLSFLGRPLPSSFVLLVVTVAPGCERDFDEADWCDALVTVERGEIELDDLDGGCERFGSGSILWLTGLPVRALCNRGGETAVLVSVRRRAGAHRPRRDGDRRRGAARRVAPADTCGEAPPPPR